MQAAFSKWCRPAIVLSCLIFLGEAFCAQTAEQKPVLAPTPLPAITNFFQLKQLGLQQPCLSHPMRLEGQVCWVNPAQKTVALIDETGGLLLRIEWLNQPLSIGDRVSLTGAGTVFKAGNVFKLGIDGLVVNDDALHPMAEQSGAVRLNAGKIPIRVDWFNGWGLFGLKVNYEGPDFSRRGIENSELFRRSGEAGSWASGLDCSCYEGWWNDLPDFDELKPVKTGPVDNFTLDMRTREVGVGIQFNGFLNIPRDGVYKFYITSDDGSRLSIGKPNLSVEILGHSDLPSPRHLFIGQMLADAEDGSWAQIEGRVTQVWPEQESLRMELSVGSSRMEVKVQNKADLSETALKNSLIRVTGFCLGAYSSDGLMVPSLLVAPDSKLVELIAPSDASARTNAASAGLPLLTRVADVHQLKREKALLHYPTRVRGVVTSLDASTPGFTLQDSTGGVYVQGSDPARVGEFVQVEGVTDPGYFAPMIMPSRISRLGEGLLPEPERPTWDQLANGSLDAQYVEIDGIVISIDATNRMQFLTRGGTISMRLVNNLNTFTYNMKQYENTLIRVRGVLFADWDMRGVNLGEVRLSDPIVTVEHSFPEDILSVPSKTPAELLLFDPQASMFQAVRMSGQIVHVGKDVSYMMVGTNGVRFVPRTSAPCKAGDRVEVAGFPQLSLGSQLLREAVVHKTGHDPLPQARPLPSNNSSAAQFDSTLVLVQGVLTGASEVGTQTVLEIHYGAQDFVARLDHRSEFLCSLPVGCRLELTGVCVFEGADQILDRHSGPFELLLNSAADVKVLAQPPWWTPRRLLVMVGVLVCVLGVAGLWITQLHRKVEQRTVQLEEQIQKRQSIEQRRAMEQERARIAQDLHDELGSGLTEISMLAAVPVAAAGPDSPPLQQIAGRARDMVTALDEIVWTMNPKHDSLQSVGSYLCLYANRFLKLANIACQLKGTLDLPGQTIDPIHRHEFFLAFKEALTNIVRHSGATEARLSIRIIGKRLRLCLADNGGGLEKTLHSPDMDGLTNMRARLEKIGGRFAIASKTGRGTTLRFYLPLN